ncbi:MAG: type III pantothenate kinase [Thermodesulfovibrionales bacterium]|nr:type III pantothenate kinase [Thermodesulfovibrionales bacterium]
MLICIDIGNSTIGFAFYGNPKSKKLSYIKKIPSTPVKDISFYRETLKKELLRSQLKYVNSAKAVISSVVPILTPLIQEALKGLSIKKILIINHRTTGGLKLKIKKKTSLGADRISSAVGAYLHHKQPLVVIDLGTATTITVVSKNGELLGGAILPGIELMKKSLFMGTAKLPDIALTKPKKALGYDTTSSIKSGLIHGTAGAIEHLVSSIQKEIGYELKIILTGGFSNLISSFLKLRHTIKRNIIFEGMRLIFLNEQPKLAKKRFLN